MSSRVVAVLVAMAFVPLPSLAQGSLPERAFLVEGDAGTIAIAAFVQADPERPLLLGKIPTRYVILVTNETTDPIWIDVEMRIKEKKGFEKIESERIRPGAGGTFWRGAMGVLEETPVPLHITVYSDETRKTVIGRERTFMYFEADDVKAFKKEARLPDGWHARDQNPADVNGVILFAAEDESRIELDRKKNIKKQVRALQERIDSGELPTFFVDRRPSDQGASCEGFTAPARNRLLDFYKEMPGLGEGTRIMEGPTATQTDIGGCRGLSVSIKARTKSKEDLVMLIRAVSDGTTHYDFAVRADTEHIEDNKQVFEKVLATLSLTRPR